MATFWVEEDLDTQSNAFTSSLAKNQYTDRRVTIKSRMRKSTVHRFRSSPKNSHHGHAPKASRHPHKRSSPPSILKKANSVTTLSASSSMLSGPYRERPSSFSIAMSPFSLDTVGRMWSTVSEPIDTQSDDSDAKYKSLHLPL